MLFQKLHKPLCQVSHESQHDGLCLWMKMFNESWKFQGIFKLGLEKSRKLLKILRVLWENHINV